MGRAGAGKGTQAKLLMEIVKQKLPEHSILYMETGAEFRKFVEGPSHISKLSKKVIESGGLLPEFLPIYIWGHILVERYDGTQHLFFDGTPRKLIEAQVLDPLFSFFGLDKPWVIYLDVDHDESAQRLALRGKAHGRKDDTAEAVVKRQQEFEKNVRPTVEWYKTNPNVNFLDIEGIGKIEDIHAEIVKRVGLS